MISWSESIWVFFGVEQRIGGYERREKREGEKEWWITVRRAVMRCAVLCCTHFFILHLLFEGCDVPPFFLLHVAVSSTSFTHTDADT